MRLASDGLLEIISGGDDGDITLSRISYDETAGSDALMSIQQFRKQDAHSSSVKGQPCILQVTVCALRVHSAGIAFLDSSTIISTSTDQRAMTWRLPSVERDGIVRMHSVITQVADVACLNVLKPTRWSSVDSAGSLVAVSGMGLEMIRIPQPPTR